jgi:ribonucleoside-diphosphate reductase beta chain
VELVLRDERWHMGFGTRLVQNAKLGHDEIKALLALGQEAAGAWGDLVSPGAVERAVRIHQRRLRAADMKFW